MADPHCHTNASDGMVRPAELVEGAVAAGLDLIAVTDHDTMAAVREVQARGTDAGLAVVAGEEVTTRPPALTHVVGWFLERPVPSGMTLVETVRAIHDQGGLAAIPHPFMPTWFASCQPGMLARLIEEEPVDGIELLFTPPTSAGRRRALNEFYATHAGRLGAAIGSSDSHFGRYDLARVVTGFPGRTAEDFREAVRGAKTVPSRGDRRSIPLGLRARQQVKAAVELPLRRLTGRL